MNRRVDPQTLKEIQMVRAGLVYAERRQTFGSFARDLILAAAGIAGGIVLLAVVYFGEEFLAAIRNGGAA